MTPEEIKRKRTESVLREIIPEALATLDDSRINSLLVTEVVCSRGRSDEQLEKQSRMEELFKQIAKRKSDEGENNES